jgi:hypothetical protein
MAIALSHAGKRPSRHRAIPYIDAVKPKSKLVIAASPISICRTASAAAKKVAFSGAGDAA